METLANVPWGAVNILFQEAKRHIIYVFIYEENIEKFEEKLGTLRAKRTSVQQEVDVAERNLEVIKADVQHWCETVDEKIVEEEKKVKDLEEKANNKCFFSLCSNIKSLYQLSRKADEAATAFDELIRLCQFTGVGYRDVPEVIVDEPSKDFETFKSRDKVFNDIMEALKEPTINMIGVWGMGGVGKTSLVKEVARQAQKLKLFDRVVTAAVTQTLDVQNIQAQIAELSGLKLEEKTTAARALRLHERLKKEKVLVVLDDVWKRLDLQEVGIPIENPLLLTSRKQDLLSDEMNAKKTFEIGVLEEEEAWEFFKKMTGNNFESDEVRSTAIEVAKKCAKLPLAIATVARALRNKPSFAWSHALQQLQNPSSKNFPEMEADVYSSIKLSYSYLENDQLRQTFLLCSLLRRDTSIDDLLRYADGLGLISAVNTLKEARNTLLTMMSKLQASCLLLDSYMDGYFDVHDIVYAVAMSIACEGNFFFAPKDEDVLQDWPDGEEMKRCNKIYLQHPSIPELPEELNCPQLVLFLMFSDEDLSLKMPTNFFKEVTNIKVLHLSEMHLSSIPSLTSLHTLCLEGCRLEEIAIIGEFKNLEILSLSGSDIESLPEEIGRLSKLKLLDLSYCDELYIIPPGILSGLSRLEELYMDGTFIQWELEGSANQGSNASLAELQTLFRLTTLNVDILDANATPWDLFFEKLQKLEKYKILIGIEEEMDLFRNYEYSRTLILNLSTSIVHLNQGIKLKKTEDLLFCELEGVKIALQKLEGEESFSHLKKLCIEDGWEIKYIINDVAGEFPELRSLRLDDLPQLISFCSEEKSGSTSIPQHELPLFNEKVSFPCLEGLQLSSINVERIWHNQPSNKSFCTHPNLTTLLIEDCDNLKQLFSSSVARGLVHLKDLEIKGCKLLREIIFMEDEDIEEENKAAISFPQLNTLTIDKCPELKWFIFNAATDTKKSFFSDKVLCPNLETLNVQDCHNLKYMFPSSLIKHFKQLLELTLDNCENMEEVIFVDGLAEAEAEGEGITTQMLFPKLEKLSLNSLPKLVRFCREGNNSKSDALALFDEKVAFPCLEDLTIKGMGMWSKIWHHKVAMERLESLTIWDCESLEEIIEFHEHGFNPKLNGFNSKLHNLKELCVKGCNKVKAKILGGEHLNFGETQPLFWVSDQETFSNLVPSFVSFQNLIYLGVSRCHGFIKLVTLTVAKSMVQLAWMTIDDCQMMEEIIASSTSDEVMDGVVFSKLKILELKKLPRLSSFCSGNCTIEFPFLEKLIMNQCPKMEIFTKGQFNTPMLQGIATEYRGNYVGHYEGNLNATVKQLFIEQASFPCLKKLHLSKINVERIWYNQPSNGSFCTHPNLTSLTINDCDNLKHLLSFSMAKRLVHIEYFQISGCKLLREIIFTENKDIEEENKAAISFPQLNTLIIKDCPKLKGFIFNSVTDIKKSFFCDKVSFPCLEKLHLSSINVERIWHNQPSNKELFSSSVARGLVHLKDLEITGCKLLREIIFMEDEDIEEENKASISFPQLNTLTIDKCPELKGFIFNAATDIKKFFFSDKVLCPNLKTLKVQSCHNLKFKYMFPSSLIKHFKQLGQLILYNCENMEEVIFVDGLAEAEGEGITTQMLFPKLEKMDLGSLPKLVRFCHEGDHSKSDALALFNEKVAFPSLKYFTINGMGMWSKIWHRKVAMERLESLTLWDCKSLEEIIEFPEHGFNPKLKGFNSKLHNLKHLSVNVCNKVKAKILGGEYLNFGETQPLFWVSDQESFSNLVPSFVSFQNLTYLSVFRCHGFINLVTLTVAKSMVQLESMTIDDCQMMEEIVASSPSDEVMDVIVFSKLETLQLDNLPSLSSFCSGNCTFEFPSLEKLIMNQCPKMKIFTKGELNTPMLQGIKSTEYGGNYVGRYEGNLNATVKQLFIEQDVQNSEEEKEKDDDDDDDDGKEKDDDDDDDDDDVDDDGDDE